MSIKTAVASVMRKFKVVADPEKTAAPFIHVKLDIMMKDVDGYQIGLEKRTTNKTKIAS
jgi:cytochrome P450 family 4